MGGLGDVPLVAAGTAAFCLPGVVLLIGLVRVGLVAAAADPVPSGGLIFDAGWGSPVDGRDNLPGCFRPDGFAWLIFQC